MMPQLIRCSECGHLHFDAPTKIYVKCVIEGCECPMFDEQSDDFEEAP